MMRNEHVFFRVDFGSLGFCCRAAVKDCAACFSCLQKTTTQRPATKPPNRINCTTIWNKLLQTPKVFLFYLERLFKDLLVPTIFYTFLLHCFQTKCTASVVAERHPGVWQAFISTLDRMGLHEKDAEAFLHLLPFAPFAFCIPVHPDWTNKTDWLMVFAWLFVDMRLFQPLTTLPTMCNNTKRTSSLFILLLRFRLCFVSFCLGSVWHSPSPAKSFSWSFACR